MTGQSDTQTQTSTATATGVFALLTAKPGVTREQIMAIMPAEIRATVELYLDGKIREWYSRVAAASSIMESLPLAKEHLLDQEYIPVGPLMPLRLLMGSQTAKQ